MRHDLTASLSGCLALAGLLAFAAVPVAAEEPTEMEMGTAPALDTATTEPVDLSGAGTEMAIVPEVPPGSPRDPDGAFFLDGVAPGLLAANGVFDSKTPDLVVTLRGGVQVSSAYFGSSESETSFNGAARIDYLRFPNGFEYGSGAAVGYRTGLGLRGSVRYIGGRNSSHYEELNGLDNVDWSLETGLGIGYEQRNYRVFVDARYGVIGHNSWVADVGADGIAYPVDGLTLTFGPRLNFGSNRFADTYFGISSTEAERSTAGLSEYNPSGGLLGVGAELGARYLWNERWGVEGYASYARLVNDAADSPITEQGSADQFSVRVGITRRISLDF